MDRAEQFRKDAARENRERARTGWRYSSALRALAVEHCRGARDEGRAWAEIADELGVSTLTLSRWLELAPTASFRAVTVVEQEPTPRPSPAGSLSAITPSDQLLQNRLGFRLRGSNRLAIT